MADLRFGFALENVADIETVKRFYVDVMQMEIEREHPTFVQFRDSDGRAYAIAKSDPAQGEAAENLELHWLTEDIEAVYAELSQLAPVTRPLTEEPFGKIFALSDPAGQVRHIVQWATDRPSTVVI